MKMALLKLFLMVCLSFHMPKQFLFTDSLQPHNQQLYNTTQHKNYNKDTNQKTENNNKNIKINNNCYIFMVSMKASNVFDIAWIEGPCDGEYGETVKMIQKNGEMVENMGRDREMEVMVVVGKACDVKNTENTCRLLLLNVGFFIHSFSRSFIVFSLLYLLQNCTVWLQKVLPSPFVCFYSRINNKKKNNNNSMKNKNNNDTHELLTSIIIKTTRREPPSLLQCSYLDARFRCSVVIIVHVATKIIEIIMRRKVIIIKIIRIILRIRNFIIIIDMAIGYRKYNFVQLDKL